MGDRHKRFRYKDLSLSGEDNGFVFLVSCDWDSGFLRKITGDYPIVEMHEKVEDGIVFYFDEYVGDVTGFDDSEYLDELEVGRILVQVETDEPVTRDWLKKHEEELVDNLPDYVGVCRISVIPQPLR